MQHSIIMRVAIGLTVFLILFAAGFGWIASHGARAAAQARTTAGSSEQLPPASGADLYATRCSACHGTDGLSGWLDRNVGADREAKLIEFLAKHGKATDTEDRAIAAYLLRPQHPKS